MPAEQDPFQDTDGQYGEGAHQGQHEHRPPQLERQVAGLGQLDAEAQARADPREELAEDGADEGEAHRDARRGEQVRKRRGHPQPPEHLGASGIDGVGQFEHAGVHRPQPSNRVEQERHHAHKRCEEDDRLEAEGLQAHKNAVTLRLKAIEDGK